MRRAAFIALLLAALALPTTVAAGVDRSRLGGRDCGVVIPSGAAVTCFWLTVPEDRTRAESATIKLAVMVLHSVAASPEPDPVVFFAGGPGGEGIKGFENFLDSPMHENRDIVLVDQRGTGMSEPSLDCPEVRDAEIDDFRHPDPHPVELRRVRAAVRECKERLVDDGVHLDAYNTSANADDIEDLRTALGVQKWNLYGISYGTRLALEVMRRHPEGVRTATLDSVYPTDRQGLDHYVDGADAAIDRLVDACNADPDCSALQPNLDELVDRVVDRYNETPTEIAVSSGEPLLVNGDDIFAGLWNAMYESEIIPALPSVIEALAGGDTSILPVFADSAFMDPGAEGMFFSVECADNGVTRGDARLAAHPGRSAEIVRQAAEPYCPLWDVRRSPSSFRRPVRSRIPTIVFAGSLDPITPASDSQRVAKTLRNAIYVELAGLGHVVTKASECARDIRQEFLEDPTTEPDMSCADAPAPPFLSQGLI